jgi:predicted nuclease with TOPRIM domain
VNELVRAQLRKIADQVEDLNDLLAGSREDLAHQQADHERLLKEFWSRQKELSVLKEGWEDYTRLQRENEAFRRMRDELRERMNRMLGWTRALTDEFRQ